MTTARTGAAKLARIAYSVPTAAEAYSVSTDTILRAIKSGKLPAKKVGSVYSVTAVALASWYDGLEDA